MMKRGPLSVFGVGVASCAPATGSIIPDRLRRNANVIRSVHPARRVRAVVRDIRSTPDPARDLQVNVKESIGNVPTPFNQVLIANAPVGTLDRRKRKSMKSPGSERLIKALRSRCIAEKKQAMGPR